MTDDKKKEITKISKQFVKGFKKTIGGINGSGWLIVDPLSGYLNAVGYKNTLGEMPKSNRSPQVLVINFEDGSIFIPAGADLKELLNGAKNWLWL